MIGCQSDFAPRVVMWQKQHGRHDLPWQQTTDPYRIWLSEIMLQQTQVSTVLAYYARFLDRFPDLNALAAAELDDVLALWGGLGYYSRARNLHRCAREIQDRFGGTWPRTASMLQTLPGIGRSTAAAISSFCFGERVAILDGNVKRVLSRVLGFDLDLSRSANQRALWVLAGELLPDEQSSEDMPAYTQGLMDIGATVCGVRRPKCEACPVAANCVARFNGVPEVFPVKVQKRIRTAESLWLLWATRPDGAVWLERRPTPGVWSGLYCMPVFSSRDNLLAVIPDWDHARLDPLPAVSHALTHKELLLHFVRVSVPEGYVIAGDGANWVGADRLSNLGLPAPIRKVLTATG